MQGDSFFKNMKRLLVVGGSIGASVILVLAMFPTVVSAQTVKSNEMKTNIVQQIKERIKDLVWEPGDIILTLIILMMVLIELFRPGGPF